MEQKEEKTISFFYRRGIFQKTNDTVIQNDGNTKYSLVLTLPEEWKSGTVIAIFAGGTKTAYAPVICQENHTYIFPIPEEMLSFPVFSFALLSADLRATPPVSLAVMK